MLHVLVKAKLGALAKVPASARWDYICRMVWRKLIDESRRPQRHLQPVQLHDVNANGMDSDFTLAYMAGDKCIKNYNWRLGFRNLESWLDAALSRLPEAQMVKLHFGLMRNDEIGGDDYQDPRYLEAMSMNELADFYSCDRFVIRRRLEASLTRLRFIILDELQNRKVANVRH